MGGNPLDGGGAGGNHSRMSGERLFPEAPVLSCGAGVTLRRHRASDLACIVEMCQDAEMRRWTTIPVPYGPGDARSFLEHLQQSWDAGTVASFAIELSGRFAGNIDLRLEEGSWAEVGYAAAPWARGGGLMTRALGAALEWGFETLGLEGVHWRAHVGNLASWRVAEKCGFRMEGTARGLLVQRGRRFDGWLGSIVPAELAR